MYVDRGRKKGGREGGREGEVGERRREGGRERGREREGREGEKEKGGRRDRGAISVLDPSSSCSTPFHGLWCWKGLAM